MKNLVKKLTIFLLGISAFGCADTVVITPPPLDHEALAREGIAPHIWEEPIVDVVDVPPGLDPEGHYYRPAHQEVVEIRQGKWQYYKDK
jgi:hypothetical protein